MRWTLYYVGRFLQLLGMSTRLFAIVDAGSLGPSPQIFGGGIAAFVLGWLAVRPVTRG